MAAPPPLKLRIRYTRSFDLVADHDGQWSRGGMLVRVEAPGTPLFAPAELEIVTPDGTSVVCAGQVVQMVPGAGVAVAFTVPPELVAKVEGARKAPAKDGGAGPEHSLGGAKTEPAPVGGKLAPGSDTPSAPTRAPAHAPQRIMDAHTRVTTASATEKIQLALHGTKDERALILRENNKTLHGYVLRNPQLGVDEVLGIAKMATMSPEILDGIAARREWAQRPEIAIALVRNPKTNVGTAIRLLDFVAPQELRQLAKDNKTRPPIQQAARKKVVGP